MDVFGTEADADDASRDAPQDGKTGDQFGEERHFHFLTAFEDLGEKGVLHEDLEALDYFGWPFAPRLDPGEGLFGDGLSEKRGGKEIGRGDGVLDGEIDADTAHGRHGMGGIADAKEAGQVPAFEAVHLDGQEFDFIPRIEFGDPLAQERSEMDDVLLKGGKTFLADGIERAFGDDEAALPVSLPVDRDEGTTGIEMTEAHVGIVRVPRDTHPEYIEGRAEIVNGQAAFFADGGGAAIGADDEIGEDVDLAFFGPGADADYPLSLADEVGDFVLHQKPE